MIVFDWQGVVICFQISIFDTIGNNRWFKIPSLKKVVICFQISIFDTIGNNKCTDSYVLVML